MVCQTVKDRLFGQLLLERAQGFKGIEKKKEEKGEEEESREGEEGREGARDEH